MSQLLALTQRCLPFPSKQSRTMRLWLSPLQNALPRLGRRAVISSQFTPFSLHRPSRRELVSPPSRPRHNHPRQTLLPTPTRRRPSPPSIPVATMAPSIDYCAEHLGYRRYSSAETSVEGMPSFAFAFE